MVANYPSNYVSLIDEAEYKDRSRVGELWTREEELLLARKVKYDKLDELCNYFRRNEGGIMTRLAKLHEEGLVKSALFNTLNNQYSEDFGCKVYKRQEEDIEEDKMGSKTWTMVSLLQEDVICVDVEYTKDGKKYLYKTRDIDIEEGDYVITKPKGKFQVAQVTKIHTTLQFDPESDLRYHWIVGRVDTSEYDKLVESDEKAYKLLVEAEKHVARKKLMEAYEESLAIKDSRELKKLLKGK